MQLTDVELKKMIDDGAKAAVDAALSQKAEADKAKEEEHKSALRAEFQAVYEENRKREAATGVKSGLAPLEKLGRLITVAAAGKCEPDRMLDVAKKMFDSDKELHGYIQKGMEAGLPSTGGFLIPQQLSSEFIDPLYAGTFLDKIGISKYPMPNGSLNLGRGATSGTFSWGAENPVNDKTGMTFDEVKLSAKPGSAYVPVSNSLLRYSPAQVQAIIARDLQEIYAIAINTAALYGKGTAYQPKGLVNVAGIQTLGSSGTALSANTPVDILALLEQANVAMLKPFWVMSPKMKSWLKNLKTTAGAYIYRDEMNKDKTLESVPFIATTLSSYTDTTIDYADLWLADWAYFAWGVGRDMELTMSKEATYVSGGVTYSAFQRDETVIKIASDLDFAVKQPSAFVHGIFAEA